MHHQERQKGHQAAEEPKDRRPDLTWRGVVGRGVVLVAGATVVGVGVLVPGPAKAPMTFVPHPLLQSCEAHTLKDTTSRHDFTLWQHCRQVRFKHSV